MSLRWNIFKLAGVMIFTFANLSFEYIEAQSVNQNTQKSENRYPDVNLSYQRQSTENFAIPIEEFNGYAGTYGELRGNHFHCGLDMRTGGVVGKKIYAADDGYVSRISISAWGFGNMIMITHPSGYKTIYGHLLKLAPKYQELLRQKQYADKSWNQELNFSPDEYPVKKGDLIAYSGNSGSSGGPHLHFEVRDENDIPVNLQLSDTYRITDKGQPIIRDVKFVGSVLVGEAYYTFPIVTTKKETEYVIKKVTKTNSKGKKYTVNQKVPKSVDKTDEVIEVPAGFYVAIDAYDYMNASSGKLAIYKYEVLIDDDLFFSFEEGNIPYDKGRYIASLLDHRLRLSTGKYYVKTQLDPANILKDRVFARRGGVCTLKDTLLHKVVVNVYDVCNNVTTKEFKVRKNEAKYKDVIPLQSTGYLMKWDEQNKYGGDGFNIVAPQGAFYSDFYFTSSKNFDSKYETLWKIGDPNIPLHKSVTLELKCNIPDSLISKAVVARVRGNGLNSVGGRYNKITQSIITQIGAFGNYVVAFDTQAPKINFHFAPSAKITSQSIKVSIGDNLSGIENFKVTIDDHWVVAEYDGKSSTLEIPLQDAKITKGKTHTMEVELSDSVGNFNRQSRKFVW